MALYGCQTVTVIDEPPSHPTASSSQQSSADTSVGRLTTSASPASQPSSSPKALRIAVPFLVQAPFANWDPLHEEACEEASLIMVQRFLAKQKSVTPEEAETEIQALVAWMTAQGYGYDVTATELLEVARQYYGLDGRVETDVTENRIKELLRQGYPVILPIAGRLLGNPYFSGEGPLFHVLVIVGYDGYEAITHDPGTRRGEHYRYDFDVLLHAAHDWTGVKEKIASGPKRMLVLWK